MDKSTSDAGDSGLKYSAPALEKGLDIIELMARSTHPVTMQHLVARLKRSKGELFRMLQVLEARDYIARSPGEDGYVLTNHLFALIMERPPTRSLLSAALPTMHTLAQTVQQSCHLAVVSRDDIVIVAVVDSPGDLGFSVRLGYRRPIFQSVSGQVIFAHQPRAIADSWLTSQKVADRKGLEDLRQTLRDQGYAVRPSDVIRGLIDLSAPVLQEDCAVAALTIPFVDREPAHLSLEASLDCLRHAATEISHSLKFGDSSRGA